MRFGALQIRVSLVGGILATLAAFNPAWSQSGAIRRYEKISDTAGNLLPPIVSADEFGGAVADLGDLDGNGPSVRTMAVGAIGDNDGGANRGAVYILFLSATGSVLSHQKISDTQGNFTAVLENTDDFGSSLAYLGDLDGPTGPSAAALAVGAVGDDDGGTNRGCVYILFLNSAGSVLTHQKISDTDGNFPAPLDNADEFGGALAGLGNLDGTGPSEAALAVGTVGDDDGGTNRGCVYILFLNSAGSVLTYQKISSTQGNLPAVLDNVDDFGSSVADLGDLDAAGPSATAIAVGAIGDDDGGPVGQETDRGAVYILFLSATGSVLSTQKISDTAGAFTAPLQDADEIGGAVAGLGDLDGTDSSAVALAVGSIGDDDGGSNRGATYVLFLRANGTVREYRKFSSTAGNFDAPLDNDDEFGGALVALGDLDGAGPAALALASGASFDDDGVVDGGAVYLLFLQGDVTPALASLFAAERRAEGVEIRWQLGSEEEPAEAWLERAVDEWGPWTRIITERHREGTVMIDLDRGAEGDRTYFYRLVWTESGVQYLSASIQVGPAGWGVDFALLPFAPNPADGPLVVSFTLPHRSQVSLQIYDLIGRQVASLADGVFERGMHQASWSRRAVSPGVYFVRYRFPSGQRVRRLALRY